jgi:UDP-N-acetylmuramate--alanine ligase
MNKKAVKKHIHFTGIKGVGMTPLAIIAKEAGFVVSGSDIGEEFITDAALKKTGITPLVGFSPENVEKSDIVITTGAHNGFDNIEVKRARESGIKVYTTGEAVGLFMDGKIFGKTFFGISIAGTHGKTTTTGMLATILRDNKMDPSFVIGTGNVGSLGPPGHFGRGKHFIAEADEYANEPQYDSSPKFLKQFPQIAVFTNIEFDHPDVYSSIDEIREAFLQFANQLPDKGLLIACGDDRQVRKLLSVYERPVITYGFSPDNTYVITKVSISGDHMFFSARAYGSDLGQFMLSVTGEHNALNGLGAIIAAVESGVPLEKARSALRAFTGSKRRLEYVGQLVSGAKVYDDYAHHPTEIKKTLIALRAQYPKQKIVCFFQPHTYSRTKKLFDEFIRSFDSADTVVINDIYASLREPVDKTISSKILTMAMEKIHKQVIYLPEFSDLVKFIVENKFRSDTILVTMGAGDIYKIHAQLKFMP